MKHRDYPLREVIPACAKLVEDGATIFQMWTCKRCGKRCKANTPNQITEFCHHEECGGITDVQQRGCNYAVIMTL